MAVADVSGTNPGGAAGGAGIEQIAAKLAELSAKLAEQQVQAEMIMAPAKTAKQVAGKGA